MNLRPAQRIVASVRRASSRAAAAREASALCRTFDQLAVDAVTHIDEPQRFADLLAQRDDVLALLNDHLITLRLERPTADGPEYAGAERAADTADDLIMQVRESLEASLAATSVLTARVAERANELRQEIAAVSRAGSAQHAYGVQQSVAQLDGRRSA
ncbi:MAG: hypothetical protein H7Z40_18825 [Phycisphaerae bacterium]|nr:hypothetical protein [Gemmatimonadaceae bacterium]